jgi:hypothetical protein
LLRGIEEHWAVTMDACDMQHVQVTVLEMGNGESVLKNERKKEMYRHHDPPTS